MNDKDHAQMTDFGYKQVPMEEKAQQVKAVFDSVADNYDVMNDLMSLGLHRWWKCLALERMQLRPGQKVLDVASGTGDLALKFADKVGPKGYVIASDINFSMLDIGRDRSVDANCLGNINYVLADAEKLPFQNNYFDRISIGFGLRNVTNKLNALKSMFRVLKPGGQLIILEFSHPVYPLLKPIYDAYSFNVLPALGKLIADDSESYRYLAESIRMHPNQDTLKTLMQEAGFEKVDYQNLNGGIVALHHGYKF